jgi:putative peptidoglycan lipid II flippase
VLTAILNARNHFFVAAASPVLSSVLVIAAVILFRREGLAGIAAGWTTGYLFAFVLVLAKARTSMTFVPDRRMVAYLGLASAGPYAFTAIMAQATTVTVRSVGSSLEPGTVTALQLALTVGQIPLIVLGFSIGSALVPSFARAMLRESDAFRVSYRHAQRLLGAVLIPAGLVLAVYAAPLIDVLLKRGAFDEHAAALTSQSLTIIALGLIFYAPVIVGHRALIAATESRTIAVIETISAAILIAVAVIVGPLARHYGLALAYTVVVPIAAILYARATQSRFQTGVDVATITALARRGLYAVVATIVSLPVYAAARALALPEVVALAGALAVGLICYLAPH